jgi:quercetin dioxygenase-like cupin family protein
MYQLCIFAHVSRNLAAFATPAAVACCVWKQHGEPEMEKATVETMIAALDVGVTRSAVQQGMAKLTPLHREVVATLPQGDRQEIRVLHAVLQPGDVTPDHSHRFPVTVYVTEGIFTLRLDGRPPISIGPGEVFVEPPRINMTGSNEGTGAAAMILFYVCDPDAPFADPAPSPA